MCQKDINFAKRTRVIWQKAIFAKRTSPNLPKGHHFFPKGHRAPTPNPWEKIFFAILICVLYLALPLADFRQKRHVSRSRTYFNGCFPSD